MSEDKYKLLLLDYQNLRNELSKTQKEFRESFDYLNDQIQFLFERLQLNMRKKMVCKHCEGYGSIYISPICDVGQENKCMECKGKGFVWV
jgi:DnaJ-class molecular chaperone